MKITTGIALLIVAYIIFFVSVAVPLESNTGYVKTPLMQLSDGSTGSGSFFLGSGSIRNDPVFYYYSGTDKEGYSRNRVYSWEARIFTDEEAAPYLGYAVSCRKTPILYLLNWEMDCSSRTSNYEFHIPKGSIREFYKLDGNLNTAGD